MKSQEFDENEDKNKNSILTVKKYKSAYILFSLEQRPKIKEANSDLSTQNITKIIADKWNSLDKESKEKYFNKEIEEKNKFNNLKISKKYTYNKKLIKKPVRIRTPYMFFIQCHKSLIKNENQYRNIQVIKDLSIKWNKMDKNEKQKYIKLSEKDKKRYEVEIDKYLNKVFSEKKKIKNKNKGEELISKLYNESPVINKPKNRKIIFSITKSKKSDKIKDKYSESSSTQNNMNYNTMDTKMY
jgi:hypothetical protein